MLEVKKVNLAYGQMQVLKDVSLLVRDREITPEAAIERLADYPYQDLDFAKIDQHRVQAESPAAWHIGAVQADQARDCRLVSHNVSFGALLARHDLGSWKLLKINLDSQHILC